MRAAQESYGYPRIRRFRSHFLRTYLLKKLTGLRFLVLEVPGVPEVPEVPAHDPS